MRLDSLCIWHVQVSVYCARRIPAHLRCTQCSIMLHLINICFLPCSFVSHIANPDLFVCCRTWICLDITRFYEEPPTQPPSEQFVLPPLGNRSLPQIVIGDFNSHNTIWGYDATDNNGVAVVQWAESNSLTLIHDAKLQKSFNSA